MVSLTVTSGEIWGRSTDDGRRPARMASPMIRTGILNPAINSLVSRVRHTNTLVLADRGFPFWPAIETIDISLSDNIPRVLDVS